MRETFLLFLFNIFTVCSVMDGNTDHKVVTCKNVYFCKEEDLTISFYLMSDIIKLLLVWYLQIGNNLGSIKIINKFVNSTKLLKITCCVPKTIYCDLKLPYCGYIRG